MLIFFINGWIFDRLGCIRTGVDIMSITIVEISKSLRDRTQEALDKGNTGSKTRPYYLGLSYNKETAILLPLRSHCPRDYTLLINHSDSRKVKHGIDFSKMILIPKSMLSSNSSQVHFDDVAKQDILSKLPAIKTLTNQTIADYKEKELKKFKRMSLSSKERFLDERSTLVNYHRELGIHIAIRRFQIEQVEKEVLKRVEHYLKKNHVDSVQINRTKVYGSFAQSLETHNVDIKVVIEFSGDLLEEDFQNLIKMNEYVYGDQRIMLGVTCPSQTGTIEQYLSKLEEKQQEETLEIIEHEMI